MIGPSFAGPFLLVLLSRLRAAHRATAGEALRLTHEVKNKGKRRGTRAHGSSATQASHSLSEAVFLRARVEAGISTSTAPSIKARIPL